MADGTPTISHYSWPLQGRRPTQWRESRSVPLVLKSGMSWWETYARCVQVAPEAFDSDRLRNLIRGEWLRIGRPGDHVNSIDGTPIPGPPLVTRDEASMAVDYAVEEHKSWAEVD